MSWLSDRLKRSKRRGTGIYSWGKSSEAMDLIGGIPGVGKLAVASLEGLSEGSDKVKADLARAAATAPAPTMPPPGGSSEMDPKILIALGVGAYFLFGKK